MCALLFSGSIFLFSFQTDKMLSALEASGDLSCVIVHVDMDMLFAAVEVRDASHLKDKPIAVGGNCKFSSSKK